MSSENYEVRVKCSRCGKPTINPKDDPDIPESSRDDSFIYVCGSCGEINKMSIEDVMFFREAVEIVSVEEEKSPALSETVEIKFESNLDDIREKLEEIKKIADEVDSVPDDSSPLDPENAPEEPYWTAGDSNE